MSHVSSTMSVASVMTLALAGPAVGAPQNDNCEDADPIGDVCGMQFDATGANGSNVGGACFFGGPDVFYCYTAPRSGVLNISVTVTNAVDGVLAVYDGCDCSGTQLACRNEGFGQELVFSTAVLADESFLIQLGGDTPFNVPIGELTAVVSDAPPEIVCPAPAPIECTSPDGETVTLDVSIADPDSDLVTVTWEIDGDVVLTEPVIIDCSAVASLTETFELGEHSIIVTVDDGETTPNDCEITLSIRDTAPPEVRCQLIPIWWHFFHVVWFSANDACDGEPVIDAYLTAGGQQAAVHKWQIVFINCYAETSDIDAGWILKAEGPDVALDVTATDADGNVATCTSTVCDGE